MQPRSCTMQARCQGFLQHLQPNMGYQVSQVADTNTRPQPVQRNRFNRLPNSSNQPRKVPRGRQAVTERHTKPRVTSTMHIYVCVPVS